MLSGMYFKSIGGLTMLLQILPMILALAFLMFFSFKKVNIIFLSIASALLLAVLSNQSPYAALTETYMSGAAGYVKSYFLLFFFSVIFGKLMELSGAASSIAAAVSKIFRRDYAILGIVIACAVLVYGGISGLVVAFAMYPIALAVCQQSDLPCNLIPGAIATGAFTFTTACLPGAPSVSNATCSTAFGTTAMAAPLLGILCGIFCLSLSSVYLIWEQRRARKQGRHFVVDAASMKILEKSNAAGEKVKPIAALIPPACVVIALNVFGVPIIASMALGCLVCIGLFFRTLVPQLISVLDTCATSSARSILFTATVVGFGSVVKESAGFQSLIAWTETLNMSPYISFALGTTLLAGFSGSSTGGLAISTAALGPRYLAMGLNPEALHRLATISAVGLDSLPHNGAVNTLLSISGLTHKDGYIPIFVTTVLTTILTMIFALIMIPILY